MIQTLSTMSGKTHKVFRDSKSITTDLEKLMLQNEGKVTMQYSTKEVPVIEYNDLAFISERNSIVFRAGDSPIWNRNETILPMSWRLFQNTIIQPGKEYTLQTIPTLSSALDFDVRKNQPDFMKMVQKRQLQARYSADSRAAYMRAYGYSDYDMDQIDPDTLAAELMDVINQSIREKAADENGVEEEDMPADWDAAEAINDLIDYSEIEDNFEIDEAIAEAKEKYDIEGKSKKIFCDGLLAPIDLVGEAGHVKHGLDSSIVGAFKECRAKMFKDKTHFMDKGDGSLYSADGFLYIKREGSSAELRNVNKMAQDPANQRVFADADITRDDVEQIGGYTVQDYFIRYLAKLDSWEELADGAFESEMIKQLDN